MDSHKVLSKLLSNSTELGEAVYWMIICAAYFSKSLSLLSTSGNFQIPHIYTPHDSFYVLSLKNPEIWHVILTDTAAGYEEKTKIISLKFIYLLHNSPSSPRRPHRRKSRYNQTQKPDLHLSRIIRSKAS